MRFIDWYYILVWLNFLIVFFAMPVFWCRELKFYRYIFSNDLDLYRKLGSPEISLKKYFFKTRSYSYLTARKFVFKNNYSITHDLRIQELGQKFRSMMCFSLIALVLFIINSAIYGVNIKAAWPTPPKVNFGEIVNGDWYISPDRTFKAEVPENLFRKNLTFLASPGIPGKSPAYVAFTDSNNWMVSGYYDITRYKLSKKFDTYIAKALPDFLSVIAVKIIPIGARNGNDSGYLSEQPTCYKLSINQHSAYQCYAKASFKSKSAALVTTALNFNNNVYIILAAYPINLNTQESTTKLINWQAYNKFISSLQEM